jgi:hypothetical protein
MAPRQVLPEESFREFDAYRVETGSFSDGNVIKNRVMHGPGREEFALY